MHNIEKKNDQIRDEPKIRQTGMTFSSHLYSHLSLADDGRHRNSLKTSSTRRDGLVKQCKFAAFGE